jgi:ABC-type glutathione transport system ATPase component
METNPATRSQTDDLLVVRDLQVEFETRHGVALVVDGINYVVRRGETVGLVGESGCGKSVSSLALLGLLPQASASIAGCFRLMPRNWKTSAERMSPSSSRSP